MGISVKKSVICITVTVLLVMPAIVHAVNHDSNDPNKLDWSRWDAVIKNHNDANELLEAKCRAVLTVLANKEFDHKQKEQIVDKIMTPIFDFPLMSKLALGRKNWPKLNEQHREKFTNLFVERLKNFYLEKITLYKDEKVLFKPATQKKNIIQIPMVLDIGWQRDSHTIQASQDGPGRQKNQRILENLRCRNRRHQHSNDIPVAIR